MKVVLNKSFGGFGLSKEAMEWLTAHGYKGNPEDYSERTNPFLVACVKILGEDANDTYANLVVVDIDDDRYDISDYDGIESLWSPNNTEWIINKYK